MTPREAVDLLHRHVNTVCDTENAAYCGEGSDETADLVEAVVVLDKLVAGGGCETDMSRIKYAPDMWRVNPDEPLEIETDDEARCTVAIVEVDNCDNKQQAFSDARVMAAAPDLLSNLKDIVKALENRWKVDWDIYLFHANAAITKAETR